MLTRYVIEGGKKLYGDITISGGKNAAVAIIAAALLVDGVCRIENIPNIRDTAYMLEILRNHGAIIKAVNSSTLEIDCSRVNNFEKSSINSYDIMRKIRPSYYFIGAMLGRFGNARASMPGGCNLGVRPIDQHIKGFKALGADVEVKNGIIYASTNGRLVANSVYLDMVSVGATINIMIAATLAEGMTVIENAAKEPHIVDLANFLNSMGADVKGAGTDIIKIKGMKRLTGGSYSIIPDQIEAGTYMAAVAAAGGDVTIKNVIPKHLECITAKLSEAGVAVYDDDDSVRVVSDGKCSKVHIKTMPYPGFPTDMQPQFAAFLACAEGTSIINESVWNSRFRYVDELKRMGADIKVDGNVAIIEGVSTLTGAVVNACDLRAGAAMVIAGLMAQGRTEVEDVEQIERGYEDMIEKLSRVGASIWREEIDDGDRQHIAL